MFYKNLSSEKFKQTRFTLNKILVLLKQEIAA